MAGWYDDLTREQVRMIEFARLYTKFFGEEAEDVKLLTINSLAAMLQDRSLGVPWDRDIIGELARNDDCPGILADGWWQRSIGQIDAVTIHHTLSDSPHVTARRYVQKGGGRPSIPYTIWISQTGEILLCNPLTDGCWHDHTGHRNTHLSVGLAGELHKYRPSTVQLLAAVRVCKWAIRNKGIPLVSGIEQITGHMDWYSTVCPGWLDEGEGRPSGEWRSFFYGLLKEALDEDEDSAAEQRADRSGDGADAGDRVGESGEAGT